MSNPHGQTYDWILRLTLHILVFFIILFLLRPLWKLTSTRSALIIVFSRAVGNLFKLLADLPAFIYYDILKNVQDFPESYSFIYNANIRVLFAMQAIHILALAINRVHALFFPFHYKLFAVKKRYFYCLCLFVWILSTIIGYYDIIQIQIYIYNFQHNIPYSTPKVIGYHLINGANFCAALCYIAFGFRLLWNKTKKNNDVVLSNTQTEKGLMQIFFVCLSCLVVSGLRIAVLDPLASYALKWPDLLRTIFHWTSFGTYLVGLCTEEISLAILVPDFRKNIAQQFRIIFCKKSNVIGVHVQQERNINTYLDISNQMNNSAVGT